MTTLVIWLIALVLIAGICWYFFAPRKAQEARVENGVQHAHIVVQGGYEPAIVQVQAGQPIRLDFDRREGGECSSHVVFDQLGLDIALPANETTHVELPALRAGDYPYACGMNMLHGMLRVVPSEHEQHDAEQSANDDSSHNAISMMSHDELQAQQQAERDNREHELHTLKQRLIIGLICTIPLLCITMIPMIPGIHAWWHAVVPAWVTSPWTQLILTLPVMFYCGWPVHRTGWMAIAHRAPEMNALVTLGTCAAFGYSLFVTLWPQVMPVNAREPYYEAVGTIITLMILGQVLEAKARAGTGEAIKSLLELRPHIAHVVRNGNVEDVPTETIQVGDILQVRAGEHIPTDGVLITGTSDIDESMITGESMPVHKTTGDTLTGATVNGEHVIDMRATRVGADTTLAQIIRLVRTAQTSKAPIQRIADKVAGVFVPAVICIAILTFAIWFSIGGSAYGVQALVCAICVLVIACPCALGLATPLSITIATGTGARHGVLYRNAQSVEQTSHINVMVFDKTGTITQGKPSIVEAQQLQSDGSWSPLSNDNLAAIAAVESQSEHALGLAITQYAQQKNIQMPQAHDVHTVAGQGVQGIVDGQHIFIGNSEYITQCTQQELEPALLTAMHHYAEQGASVVLAARDRSIIAMLAIADAIKPDAAGTVQALHERGIQVVMLTGDHEDTARHIAKQVGITNVIAGVLPQDKELVIRMLQDDGYHVAMVGDGINDAPALVRADIGMAMGTGTDVAIESADITMMHGSTRAVVRAYDISRATMRNIKQNLGFALGYNGLGIPIAAGVLYPFFHIALSPMIAGAAMAFSSLSVVLNANRLRTFQDGHAKPSSRRTPVVLNMTPIHEAVAQSHEEHVQQHMMMKELDMNESNTVDEYIDPICGMVVDPQYAADTREYKGKTIYFCNPHCAEVFDTNPAKYVQEEME